MEKLGIDPKILIAQVINFGLFVFIFVKLIAKPFLAVIELERKKDEERTLLFEKVTRQEAELAKQEAHAREKIRKEADMAMAKTRKEVAELKKELINNAQLEAKELVDNVRASMKESQAQFERELKEKLVTMSVIIVKNALQPYLDEGMQKNVNERILTQLSNQNLNRYES
jgi:F-type H+-transporting ATPase subunit b